MSRIKGENTSPELEVRRLIYSMGYRYRLHAKDLPGKPDIVFRGRRKVVFVHGCFWHQHKGCKEKHVPKSNLSYWKPKLEKTVKRDDENRRKLVRGGWEVLVVWNCYLSDIKKTKKMVKEFLIT